FRRAASDAPSPARLRPRPLSVQRFLGMIVITMITLPPPAGRVKGQPLPPPSRGSRDRRRAAARPTAGRGSAPTAHPKDRPPAAANAPLSAAAGEGPVTRLEGSGAADRSRGSPSIRPRYRVESRAGRGTREPALLGVFPYTS